MKQYVIDELRPGESERIRAWLDENIGRSAVDGVYWIGLDPEHLTSEQAEHESCRPHRFAVALDDRHLACELLIRSASRIRCSCVSYADESQCLHIMRFADALFETLNLKT